MDIKEIKEKQCKLEDTIFNLVYKFNKETNVILTTINLEMTNITMMGGTTSYLLNKIKTTIEI